ncbi:T9SS C-terminal target domain-containing protein [Sphingobacterium paucimobilis]|uniref:DUF7507 domain-containing protein n=1 Tax=Sphingobacterium paucimobilis HER1398 TaxID=1346330 RepID=U2JE21_9SPHI|nr:T9SS C-terminal target domain-containing protein [Sphingobacterium paucimobilis]ERJ60928.1 hypothetical protein M472_19415 [Sphingobacterium paucimobilis HER1398]
MKFKFRGYLGKVFLWLLTMLTVVGTLQAQSGRINADLAAPNLEVENGAKTFRVRINKTATECTDGSLNIKLPSGFKYVSGTAKVGGANPSSEEVSNDNNAVTIPLGIIPADASGYVEVSFDVEALCGALSLKVEDRFVTYTLKGCGAPTEGVKANGNIINLQFAVLNISVTPNLTMGLVGQELTRTITVKNSGTGGLPAFKLPVNYGNGIIRSQEGQEALPTGLTFNENDNTYSYNGNFVAGSTLTFTEKVTINNCEGLLSTYEAVYGKGCERNNKDKASVAVEIDDSKRPRLVITDVSDPAQMVCMGKTYTHKWVVKNTGNAPASSIVLDINATTIEGTVAFAGANDAIVAVNGSKVTIDRLKEGAEITLTFNQLYAAPASGTDCASAPKSYTTESTGYKVTYIHKESCIGGKTPEYAASATTKGGLTFAFAGENVGEQDIIGAAPYEADFKIGTWSFPKEGLGADAYLEIAIDLSADLSKSNLTDLKLFNGANDVATEVTKVSETEYKIKIKRDALIQNTEGNWRLKFPLTLTCPTTEANPSYKITSTLHNCDNRITFACETIALDATCPTGDCDGGGMHRGKVSLQRVTIGLADADNNGIPDSNNPATGLGESIRSFVAGDIIEIAQQGTVIAPKGTADYVWKNGGRFEVSITDAALGLASSGLFGKVEVVRNGATAFTFENIAIQSEGNRFFITLPAENQTSAFAGFVSGDKVTASLQLKATKANANTGLKRFVTGYGLYDASKPNPNLLTCGILDKVSGYYASTALNTGTDNGTYNIPGCESGKEGAGFKIDFAIDGDTYRNALFPDEFRQIAKPKTVTFTVSSGLNMKGYRVELEGNGANPTHIDVNGLSVSGGKYTIDADKLAEHLRALKGNSPWGVIDEGFTFIVRPIVTPNCSETSLKETIKVSATVDGSFYSEGKDHVNAVDVTVKEQTLNYNTDNDKLEVKVSQVSTIAYTQEAKWLVKVSNRSEFRKFDNLWLAKTAGNVDISSIIEVESLTNMTEVNSGISKNNGGVYNLTHINAEQSRYFLVTAAVINCKDGNIEIAYGSDCKGVPASVAEASCKKSYAEELSFVLVDPILQTTVIDDPGVGPLPICEPITYIVEINNAGGEAKDLKLNIKMASFLNYVGVGNISTNAYMSDVYTTRPGNIIFKEGNPIQGVGLSDDKTEAIITIPASFLKNNSLQNGERFYLKFQLQVASCEFKSGQTVTLTPSAENFCGKPVTGKERILEAGTDRIILEGAPDKEPVVDLEGSVNIDLTPAGGTVLKATYTAFVTNVGNDIENYPITGATSNTGVVYKYALKLPEGWVIDNDNDDAQALVAANKLIYKGADAVKGYIFEFGDDLNHQERIKLSGKIKFVGDLKTIDCEDGYLFGNIHQEVYTNFQPVGTCLPLPGKGDCGLMELLTKDHSTPFKLSRIKPDYKEQAFCIKGTPNLSQVVLTNKGIVEWYRDAERKERILDSELANEDLYARYQAKEGKDIAEGKVGEIVYYAANRLVEGSTCLSENTEVRIVLEVDPIANAGPDQLKYNDGKFTLAANRPVRSSTNQTGSSGEWIVITQPAKGVVKFSNKSSYNSTATIEQGNTATLEWQVKNDCGSASDRVEIRSEIATIELTKSVKKQGNDDVKDKDNDGRHSKGDEIEYEFVIKNTGEVTLKAPFRIVDEKLGWTGAGFEIPGLTELVKYQEFRFSAPVPYEITQKDMNDGKVVNTATVTGKTPEIPTGSNTPIDIKSKLASKTTDLIQAPKLQLIKSITFIEGKSKVGDKITYTFKVTNTGNVTIKDLKLTDAKLGLNSSKTFNPSTIDPGKTAIATADYELVQDDLDRGHIKNTAKVEGTDPKDNTVEDVSDTGTDRNGNPINDPSADGTEDPTILDLVREPSIKVEKTGVYKGDKDRAKVGDKVEYTFVVTNTGNMTLKDVSLTDTEFSGKGSKLTIKGPDGNPSGNTVNKLAPKATLTYTATYSLTQEDIDAGKLINQASVTANPNVLDPVKPLPPVTGTSVDPKNPTQPNGKTVVSIPQIAGISVEKSASRTEFSVIGDDITYTIKVTNTGNVTLKGFEFSDTMFPNWAPNPKLDKLEPGDSREYTIVKTITQEILTAGKDLFNKMTVMAKDPNGEPVEGDDNVTVTYKKNVILASPDKYGSFNGREEHTTRTVLENDKLNDVVVQSGQVILTPGIVVDKDRQPIQGIVMNVDGTISIAKGVVPAGTYTYPYTICEALNTTNCSSTEAIIIIIASPIKADDDTFGPINGKDKTVTPNVLDNDKLNGKPVIPSEVVTTVEKPADPRNPGEPVPTLDPSTGKVTINPETPAGEYKITYEICEVLNPTNCSTAIVTITVVAPEIKAIDDVYGTYNGKDGGDTGSVLENDLLNKVKVNPEDIELRAGVPVNERGEVVAGLSMNKTGNIHVQKETAAGKYYYPYEIEEKLNPGNKDDAVAIVTVIAAPIEAKNDKYDVNGKNGGTTPTVLDNDKLNNKTIIPNEITLTPGNPVDSKGNPTTVVKMNPDGTITVAPNTPQGRFEYPYTICEVLNPTNCANAVAIIEVQPAPIVAENDTYKVEWTRDKVTTGSVLSNDKYNEKPIDLDEVTLQPGVPSNPGLTMNPDGTIDIAPSTRPGTYTYPYTICEVLNPTNCSNAIATIVIEASNVFIPNTFTPNGDGVNDKFEIVGLDGYDQVKLTIVNRWGNEVYRNDNYYNEWNGSGLNEGTYYYIVTLRKGTTDTVHKGWVLIKTR